MLSSPKLFMLIVLLFIGAVSFAQTVLRNPEVSEGQLIKVIPSLKDYVPPAGFKPRISRKGDRVLGIHEDNEEMNYIKYTKGVAPDPVVQRFAAQSMAANRGDFPNPSPNAASVITQNFAGMGYTNVAPADPTMCAGPNHIIQMINGSAGSYLKIWNRSGVQVLAQIYMTTMVGTSGYSGSGDPIAIYDQFADRFMVTEFARIGGSNINSLVVFVSQTNDPTGGWYVYKFTDVSFFPDYPHYGVWPNVLYASTNDFNSAGTAYLGSSVYAMNKAKMIAGDATAELQRFRLTFNCAPVNVSGPTAPGATGTVAHFMYYNDNDYNANPGAVDSIGMMNFSPNFAVPASTTLTYAQALVTAPFKSVVCGGRNCVPSQSGNGYDAISDRVMNRVMYRNFGSYEALVLNYTVDANAGTGQPAKAGIRWYELRKTGGPWSIYQQSTYSPDGDGRWMGSININSKGQIALGFDRSGATSYASICFTGRNATDPLNVMSVAEQVAKAGTGYGTFGNRWGDYNDLPVDVVNDSLFWFTSMYGNTASAWATQIVQFKIGDCDVQSSTAALSQSGAAGVQEGNNVTYTNTVNNTGCVPITNFLITDTLPTNVTYVAGSATNGGTYNAGNRVVSFPVTLNAGQTQTYAFTVTANIGSYFATTTSINEPVAGATIPAGWAATLAQGPTNWVSSATTSHSAPNALFGADNATAITDFRVSSTTQVPLGATPATFSFWHSYNTETSWDGGVVEISVNNGTTWTDLGTYMTVNGYPGAVGTGNPVAGRAAFTGNSGGWLQTKLRLLPTGQNALFRFRMTSDDNTAATGTNVGWYVDDILLQNIAEINIRSSYFNASGVRISYKDTFTTILPGVGCVPQTVTTHPTDVTTCAASNTSFSVTAAGTAPLTYQWQLSTAGTGGPWNPIANGGVYGGATTSTLTLTGVLVTMNGYQYRCVVSGCAANVNSNPAILTVSSASIGGTVTPANSSVCGSINTGTLTLSGYTGSIVRWESATALAGPYTPIVNTTNTYTYNNITQTMYYRAVVQVAGCTAVNSSVATVTYGAALPMVIVADPGTTLCAGDPTRLTAMEGNFINATIQSNTFANNNAFGLVIFNFRNNNAFPVTITGIESIASTSGPSIATLYYKTTPIAGAPGAISAANGWNQIETGNYTAVANTTTTVPQVFLSGLTALSIPAGATYGIAVESKLVATGVGNLRYSTVAAGTYTYSAGGCDFITGTNIGYAGNIAPAVLTNTPRGFLGKISFSGGLISPITTGTFLWSPAAGLSSTTSNPVAASPMTTTTYTVSNDNGAGCVRQASITITVNQRPVVTTQPTNTSVCAGLPATFTVVGTGTALTYQWQVSTTGPGGPWTALTNVAPYAGVTTAILTVSPTTVGLSGNLYRCVLNGTCSPVGTANISNPATLTVVALPTVTIAPASPVCGGVAGTNGTLLTASGANTYTWAPTTGLYTNAAATVAYTGSNSATVYAAPGVNTVYTVTGTSTVTGCTNTASITVNYTPVAPTVNPVSATICLGSIQPLTITSSLAPATASASSGPISIIVPDGTGDPALATLNISGIPAIATISQVKITFNMTHTYVGDMDINIKAPNNAILNLVGGLDNGAGTNSTDNFTNTAFSSTSVTPISGAPAPRTGTYAADALAGYGPTGYLQTVTTWNALTPTATSANGNWTLAMGDWGGGDVGTLTSWSIEITYGLPSTGIWSLNSVGSGNYTGLYLDAGATTAYAGTSVQTVYAKPSPAGLYNYYVTVSTGSCSSPGKLVPVTVNQPAAITSSSPNVTLCTDKVATFSVTATGTALNYQWQVSINSGVTFLPVTNGGVYSGATSATLTITAPPVTMSGYQYRCVVQGAAPCAAATSTARTLIVNPLPVVVLTATSPTSLFPGLTSTISSTVSPNPVATYTWFRNGAVLAGANTGQIVVDVDGLGDYTLTVTDVNGCTSTSNNISITDSVTGRCFIYPNPSGGKFQVRYYSVPGNTLPRGIVVYNADGNRVLVQNFTVSAPYARMDVDMRANGKGLYWVEIVDRNGNRISMCRVVIQ